MDGAGARWVGWEREDWVGWEKEDWVVEEWLEVRRVESVDMEEVMGAALDREGMLDAGMLPVLMLLGSGKWLCVSGAAFIDTDATELWVREGAEEEVREETSGKFCWVRDMEEGKVPTEDGPMFRGPSTTGESS